MTTGTNGHPSTRIALITGASRGIGRSTALDLARNGVDVIITYVSNVDEAKGVVAEIEEVGRSAVALPLDLGAIGTLDSFVADVAAVLRGWGRDTFDHLVNNGGNQRPGSFVRATEDDFDHLIDVHLKGPFFLTQKLAPLMADGGSIINLSSGVTRFYVPEHVLYASAKGAVEVLTRYLAQELGPRGITVNAIAPGATATDFSGGMLRDNAAVQDDVASTTAMGRFGVAEDVSPAIAALLSDANHWVTGQRLEVSGGVHL